MPRLPSDACGRSVESGSGGSLRSARTRLSAAARSAAVSASVPSRSNSTARTGKARGRFGARSLEVAAKGRKVVDRGVGFEPVAAGERVIGHALEVIGVKAGLARKRRELRGLDESGVVVRAAGQ